jgi:hypothetical protein
MPLPQVVTAQISTSEWESGRMSGSYQGMLHELADHGLGPLAGQRAAVRARRAPSFDIFAKSEPRVTRHTDHFTALLHELRSQLDRRDQRAAQLKHEREFAKSLRALGTLHKSYLKPIVIRKDALTKRPRPAEVIAKAFRVLRTDATLTAEQRGLLAMKLGELTERAESFVKSHPLIADIDDIKVKLDRALADGHAGDSAPVIREALALIDRGRITPADHMRLSMLLNEIRSRLNEVSDAQKD